MQTAALNYRALRPVPENTDITVTHGTPDINLGPAPGAKTKQGKTCARFLCVTVHVSCSVNGEEQTLFPELFLTNAHFASKLICFHI